MSATMQGVGHGAGVYGHNLEGGLGGPPPPNVDGEHHFRKKYGFAIKTATICARNIRPTDACGGAFKFEFIFFGTDTCFFVKNIGTNARFKEFGSKFRLFALLVGGVVWRYRRPYGGRGRCGIFRRFPRGKQRNVPHEIIAPKVC